MREQTLTLTIPDVLYQRLKRQAEGNQRTVAEEALAALLAVVPVGGELPADLEQAVSPLSLLDDEALWRAARSQLAAEDVAQMEELHARRDRQGLAGSEAEELAALVRRYERAMLVRAQAAALLRQRGHDISALLKAS
jgi:hypothetical protein